MSSRLHFHDDDIPTTLSVVEEQPAPATWETTLADLEANVERVEAATTAAASHDAVVVEDGVEGLLDLDVSWVPPADLGPLPDHLRERATLLLSRQLALAEQLVHDITWSKKQRDVAAKMAYAKTRPAGAFFDNRL